MSVLEEIISLEFEDVFAKLVNGINKRTDSCKSLLKEDLAVLSNMLSRRNAERTYKDCDDSANNIFVQLCRSLLHALVHDKEGSSFDFICECISVCIKSSMKCQEIINEFLIGNIKSYIKNLREMNSLISGDDNDEDLIIYCPGKTRISVSSILHLLLNLSKDDQHLMDENVSKGSNCVKNDEIFHSLLEMLNICTEDAILAVLSEIIKLHLKSVPVKKKVMN